MKRELRGIKRSAIQLDFDLYRVNVPMPGVLGNELSVIDIRPTGVERTMVLVHGYAGSAETWEYQINTFAREYRVVVPDLRGHGQSDAPYTRYTMQELVADLYAITQYLHLPDRFELIGHSFGGSICVEYASAHPEQIDHLVLIATAGEYPIPKAAAMAYRLPTAILRPVWKYRPRWNAELHVMKRMAVNNMLQWRGWGLMQSLHVPTLVITGERDTYFPRQVVEKVADVIPGAERVDVGASKHKIQLERHQAVNRAIQRFIQADAAGVTWRRQADEQQSEPGKPWLKAYGQTTPHTVPIPDRPLSEFLTSAADWFPKRAAAIFQGHKLTYGRLSQQANQFAHALRGLGVTPGDRVLLFLPNSPQLLVTYYGTLRAGGVVVAPSLHGDLDLVAEQARATGAEVVVTLEDFGDLARRVQMHAGVREVLTVNLAHDASPEDRQAMLHALGFWHGLADSNSQPAGRSLIELIKDAPVDELALSRTRNDLAVIAYTQDLQGRTRGACLTHGDLVANTLQLRHWLYDLQYGQEVFVSVLPLLHAYGMTAAMNLPVAVGATMLLMPGLEMQGLLDLIWTHQPTIFPGQPALFAAISRVPDLHSYGFSSIRTCLSGGAPMPVEIHEAFERLTHRRLLETYTLAEATCVALAQPLQGPREIGSVGMPLPDTSARIVDPHLGVELPAGQIGELQLSGPQVMAGYWQETGINDVFDGDWLRTGDLAIMDSDGVFRVLDQARDVIWLAEGAVYPRDVEEVLYENNHVQEAVVVGSTDAANQPQIVAYVVLRPGSAPTAEELIHFCQRRLEPYAAPTVVIFCDALPRSAIGKVIRSLLTSEPTTNRPG